MPNTASTAAAAFTADTPNEEAHRPAPDEGQRQSSGVPHASPISHVSLGDTLGRPGALSSPAARLQATLDAEFAPAMDEERWPLRWTLAMVTTTCGAFWLGVYFVIAALIG